MRRDLHCDDCGRWLREDERVVCLACRIDREVEAADRARAELVTT